LTYGLGTLIGGIPAGKFLDSKGKKNAIFFALAVSVITYIFTFVYLMKYEFNIFIFIFTITRGCMDSVMTTV
jgi:predicted MFS family arabinose efflux permease